MINRADIQGNILRGYSHPSAAYVFMRVTDAMRARGMLRTLSPHVTVEEDWRVRPSSTLNIALTFEGLAAIGADLTPFSACEGFCEGMWARARERLYDIGTNDPELWEIGAQDGTHLLFIIYAVTEGVRDREAARLVEACAEAGMLPTLVQHADCLRDGREHFGFRDGFSQPVVAPGRHARGQGVRRRLPEWPPRTWRPLRLGEFLLGHVDEDGVVPGGRAQLMLNGTFMVWRKLEQHVATFNAWIAERGGELEIERDVLKAQVVGRWPDGSSLVRRPPGAIRLASKCARDETSSDEEPDNTFTYAEDRGGTRCPLGAHVRRANPRLGLGWDSERTRRHRIIRRGMPYGKPYGGGGQADDGDRGLIFACFNASIERQFELIQRHWLMDGDTFGLGRDRDLLTAPADPSAKMMLQGDRAHRPRVVDTGGRQFVTTRGGYYLFVPGVRALALLADP